MDALKDHTISFSGLKDGHHHFGLELAQDFFEATGEEEFLGGQVHVDVDLDKSATMLVTHIHTQGTVTVSCDRCNTPMAMAVDGAQRQIFALGGEEGLDDEELVSLPADAHQVNLTHYIYECLRLAMPLRHVHAEGQCDPDAERALARLATDTEHAPDPDPRWAALQQLKNPRP
jgi:uncharacterized metal-binding protein YceD (DUF177 family)